MAISSLVCGCSHEADVLSDSFQLTVCEIILDSDIKVSVLDIRVARDASISVDGESSHSHIVLADAPDGELREGDVFLSAARIAPDQDKQAYIQTLIRPRARGGHAGGVSVYPVSRDTTLAALLSISAKNGTYKLDSPITIAQLQDKPVTLVVGGPTK